MKILFVGYRHDYTNRWEKTNRGNPFYFMYYLPLEELAEKKRHALDHFWIDEQILEKGKNGMNRALREAMIDGGYDVCLVSCGEDDFSIDVLKEIKEKSRTVSVYICGDDSWSFERRSRHFAPYYSWVLTLGHKPAVEQYKKLGFPNVMFGQVGVNFDVFHPVPGPRDIDVSFVGTRSDARGKIVDALRRAGIAIMTRGNGWPEGSVTNEEMVTIFSHSKIVISPNPPAFSVTPKAIVRLFFRRATLGEGGSKIKLDIQNFPDNVRSWLNKRIPTTKGRNFEVAACKTMQFSQYVPGFEDIYEGGKEIIFYTDTDDLIKKIHYYLAHDNVREAIAKNAYERTVREHDIKKRISDIFVTIGRPL